MLTTPLILAASAGRIDIVKTLIEYGVNINAKNQEGHSALQYAASKGWTEVSYLKASLNIVKVLNKLFRLFDIFYLKVLMLIFLTIEELHHFIDVYQKAIHPY